MTNYRQYIFNIEVEVLDEDKLATSAQHLDFPGEVGEKSGPSARALAAVVNNVLKTHLTPEVHGVRYVEPLGFHEHTSEDGQTRGAVQISGGAVRQDDGEFPPSLR